MAMREDSPEHGGRPDTQDRRDEESPGDGWPIDDQTEDDGWPSGGHFGADRPPAPPRRGGGLRTGALLYAAIAVIAAAAAALIVLLVAGSQSSPAPQPNPPAAAPGVGGGGGQFGGGGQPGGGGGGSGGTMFMGGTVSAVSATSITLGGGSHTVTAAITGATKFTGVSGATGIKTGDRVTAQITGIASGHPVAKSIQDPAQRP